MEEDNNFKSLSCQNTFELKYQNLDLQETWRFVNENCTVVKLLFLKRWTCLSLCHKNKKRHLPKKLNVKKFIGIHMQATKISST